MPFFMCVNQSGGGQQQGGGGGDEDEEDGGEEMVVDGGDRMCVGAGGKIRQTIVEDSNGIECWDQSDRANVWIHIMDPKKYSEITGRPVESLKEIKLRQQRVFERQHREWGGCGRWGDGCGDCGVGGWGGWGGAGRTNDIHGGWGEKASRVPTSTALRSLPPMRESDLTKNLRICAEEGKCTFSVFGTEYVNQKVFKCITCASFGNSGTICVSCKDRCHRDHRVVPTQVVVSYCDCGAAHAVKNGLIDLSDVPEDRIREVGGLMYCNVPECKCMEETETETENYFIN